MVARVYLPQNDMITLYTVYLNIISRFFELGLLFVIFQADDDCCNTCEDVREAYRKKGWAVTNPDLLDQVS